ncbi:MULTISPECIES: bifunctional 4-hydroxy-2-oxoglutarate aldolase/2-dehydro-3-deoxy-phosphogluconate aldolase [unclassified Flavobacterium]|jgi:2-dehydro-3-deoxyphosphogluconate aldolase/(4S)-4-hydroxy-2-oxoglutarate aldolase|uniref:bifunctional 4-hydroxy-2-oxoglutarate aldolase/2-dehydro-3-deoxy-phosphogluconate aldolase n=1 Tax=unclassified Flavobacterium TaxID=196869 RepID=UPI0025B7CB86|nr:MULTISPECIES: bifunctional 4-hydroxy-2-oxoglutarate aldolase/2-dehydro-3-deoxy-phosphogluconate aldolase [unclassified Flavobacterium]
MDRKKKTLNQIIEQGILPLYFHPDADVSMQILKALYNAGIRVVEYTNRGETAVDDFLQLRKFVGKELPELQLGIGTIRNKIEATEFINVGADFIVSPGVVEAIAELAEKNDILWVPGCLTATEIILADDLGAQLVKLYPGSLLGPAYLTAMKEIFPHLLFMPTGGIETSEENLSSWFESGASAVGLGSKLISKNFVERKDYIGIESLTKQTLKIVQEIKSR